MTEQAPRANPSQLSADPQTLLADIFGIEGAAERLPSEVDETYRVLAENGQRYTLKVSGANERRDLLEAQAAVLQQLEQFEPALPVPKMIASRNGAVVTSVELAGETRLVRLLSWLDGVPMHQRPGSLMQMRALGTTLGQLDRALAAVTVVAPQIDLLWDIGRARHVAGWVEEIEDKALRRLTRDAFERASELEGVDPSLPSQIIHNDINPHNVLVGESNPDEIAGVIDFGDLIRAPRINDLAIACSYQVGWNDGLARLAELMGGYRSVIALEGLERDCLLPKILARLGMTVAITTHRAAANPDHAAYILRNRPISIAGLERLTSTPASSWAAILEGHPR